MSEALFLYGTLCDPELYEIVSGAPFRARPATLADVAIHWAAGESFPIPVEAAGSSAAGMLVEPDDAARARLDFYELGFGYTIERRHVLTEAGPVLAAIYFPEENWALGEPWSLEEWQARDGALSRLAAREFIGLIDTHAPEAAVRAFPQIRTRAASRLRASASPTPEPFQPAMASTPIDPQQTEQPYTDYFAVREDWLNFPTFSGGRSSLVKRASFLSGDAVTVLPYDPTLDSVLIVRQFRHGPFVRGDRNPWTLEPAAGRIDPGERPEDTAARELFEETGVEARSLHFIGRYYPSPGAYGEYLYSYIAIADLAGMDGGVGGLDNEEEDIMRHVVPLDDALALIETGAANTGPLLTSLAWLALNKSRFV